MPISPLVSIINYSISLLGCPTLPLLPIKIGIPDKIIEIKTRHGFKAVCRSVVDDLVAIERLGAYYEKLTSDVVFTNNDRQRHLVKTEDVRFFGKESHWKKPM